jgi:hypothetical protein
VSNQAIPNLPAFPMLVLRDDSSLEDQFIDELRTRRKRLDQWLRLLHAEASRENGLAHAAKPARRNRGASRK